MDIDERTLPDGRVLFLLKYLFNHRIAIAPEAGSPFFDDEWCFKDPKEAARVWATWDGEGEDGPPGWNKHPSSGRWREDGTAASEDKRR